MKRFAASAFVSALLLCLSCPARAALITFFESAPAPAVAPGLVSDTFRVQEHLFACSRDKFFTGGVGMTEPIGRYLRVEWPEGLEAQAVTVAPPGGSTSKASITISRVDGDLFDLTSFTARLLANTGGAGGRFEVMPKLNGEDAWNDPAQFLASGSAGNVFTYDESTPPYIGNTASLKGFEAYRITLYVDYALTGLTLDGAPVPEPAGLGLLAIPAILAGLRRRRNG